MQAPGVMPAIVLDDSQFGNSVNMISLLELLNQMQVCPCGACPYFPDREETLRALRCPGLPNHLHAELMVRGYRHSGDIFYVPECGSCDKCISMRISPEAFKISKKQRRIVRKNCDVDIVLNVPSYSDEKYEIYRRYMAYQHPNSPQSVEREQFVRSFYNRLPSSAEIEYRLGSRIVGVTFADIIPCEALSSVYHFFDPDYAHRSIGVFSVVAEILMCRMYEIPWYYIGYWIPGCRKMEYKSQYRPCEFFVDGQWVDGDSVLSKYEK